MLSSIIDYHKFIARESLFFLHIVNVLLLLHSDLSFLVRLKHAFCKVLLFFILDLSCSLDESKCLQISYCELHYVSRISCRI